MDFKTSQLGTCKHLEAVKHWIHNGHRVHRETPSYTSVYLDYSEGRKVRIRIGTDHEREFRQLASEFFTESGDLLPQGYSHFRTFMHRALAIDDTMRCYNDALDFVLETREKSQQQKWVDSLSYDDFAHLLNNSNTLMVTTDEMEPTANAPAGTFTTIDDDHDSEGDILLDENDQASYNREQVGETLGTVSSVASLHSQEGENDTQTYKKGTNSETHSQRSPKELVAEGVSFLTGLSKTLESPEATRELINSLVEVDQETGQTNLRIPIPDKESVVQVLTVLGKLFTR